MTHMLTLALVIAVSALVLGLVFMNKYNTLMKKYFIMDTNGMLHLKNVADLNFYTGWGVTSISTHAGSTENMLQFYGPCSAGNNATVTQVQAAVKADTSACGQVFVGNTSAVPTFANNKSPCGPMSTC